MGTANSQGLRAKVKGAKGTAFCRIALVFFLFLCAALPLTAKEKDATQYGMGLIVNVPFPESEVDLAVQDVIQNGIIRGSKEYNKDEYISGAVAADSTKVFPEPAESGKVFYKVRLKALDPRNFKDSGDIGTLAVRYIVQSQGDNNTVLHIDARFVEDFRHTMHPSNGSVESAEYKDIHDRLEAMELTKAQTVEARQVQQEHLAKAENASVTDNTPRSGVLSTSGTLTTSAALDDPNTAPQTLEQRVHDLRRQVERRVKAPGASLKSAPFHTASTLGPLPEGTEVLIVITTTYWLGVETHEGQHGWLLRDQLELLP